MAVLTVPVTTDFTLQSLLNITQINMSGAQVFATFSSTQFGTGLISNAVIINNSGARDVVVVNLAATGTFSAAGWTFLAPFEPLDLIRINGTAGIDTIIGSSRDDLIGTLSGSFASGADNLFGGAGNDTLTLSSGDLTGAIYDGGTGTGRLNLRAANATYDLRGATIIGVEEIVCSFGGITVLLDHAQVGAGQINKFVYFGSQSDIRPILVISGGSVDLPTAQLNGTIDRVGCRRQDYRRQRIGYIGGWQWRRFAAWRAG